jgi:hypothetical protein
MKKQTKAVRIRKLVLAGFRDVAIAKMVKCHANYVYIVRTKMAETMPMVKPKNLKEVNSLLQRQVDAAKDTGVPPRKNAHRVRVIQTKRLRMMADAPKKEADALDHWDNAVTPKSILDEAQGIIWGDREKTYGEPDVNLNRIAVLWNAHLTAKSMGGLYVITPEDVCWMMVLLKASRQMNAPKRDNLVDAAGYIGLIERIQK